MTESDPSAPVQGRNSAIKQETDLYRRSVRGSFWVIFLRIVTQGLSWGRYVILANILGRENMGLLGVASLLMLTLDAFSRTGFDAALIQKKECISDYLNTAWIMGIIRGIVLYLLLFSSAPLMAMIKVPPEKVATTINVIRVIGLTFIIGSLTNIGTVYFRKEMDFNRQFYFETVSSLAGVISTILIAVFYRTVWALVWGRLLTACLRMVMSYWFHTFRPRLEFDMDKFKELWRFGRWILGGTILGFIMNQGDDYFVWGLLGLPALGLYQMAFRFAEAPATEITLVIGQVTFPAYSKIQDDTIRLKEAYLKVLYFTAFITVPASGLIFSLSQDFANLFLLDTEDWAGIVPVMQILSVHGMFHAISATRGPVFHAIGRPNLTMKISLFRLFLLAVLIYPLTAKWGVTGTAWTLLIIAITVQVPLFRLIVGVIRCTYWETIRPVFFPLIGTLAMGFSIWLLREYVFSGYSFVALGVYLVIAFAVYIGVLLLFEKLFGYHIRSIVFEQVAVIRGKGK